MSLLKALEAVCIEANTGNGLVSSEKNPYSTITMPLSAAKLSSPRVWWSKEKKELWYEFKQRYNTMLEFERTNQINPVSNYIFLYLYLYSGLKPYLYYAINQTKTMESLS